MVLKSGNLLTAAQVHPDRSNRNAEREGNVSFAALVDGWLGRQ